MSMNLIYDIIDEKGEYIASSEFPIQTQTELTMKVLATNDKSEQIKILEEYYKDNIDLISGIKYKLKNPHIILRSI